jgi:hypothetical protein
MFMDVGSTINCDTFSLGTFTINENAKNADQFRSFLIKPGQTFANKSEKIRNSRHVN